MANIEDLIKRVERFKTKHVVSVSKSLRNNKRVILTLQRDQLLSGKTSDGVDLTPTYSSDPFFKKPESREKYIKKKREREATHAAMIRYHLFAAKNPDVPNLIFSNSLDASKFQKKLHVSITNNELTIISTWSKGKHVERKYPTALGLNKTSVGFLWDYTIREDLVDYWENM